MKETQFSIIVPCYNEDEVLEKTSKRLLKVIDNLQENLKIKKGFILFIDDGSEDRTWEIIKSLAEKSERVKGIRFSRNYGHQNALFAGFMYCKDIADCVLSIDADLQQNEKEIVKFLEKYDQGFEIVNGVRSNRDTDSFFKKFSATFFYKLMNLMGVQIIENSADYRLLDSKVIRELSRFEETNLFLRGLFPILGFRDTTVEHSVRERFAGKSKYSLSKMVSFAINGITSFSITPLRLITIIGFISMVFCIFMIVYSITISLFSNQAAPGWASTVVPLYFLGSIQILSLGVIGEYLGKIYMESKRRPRYIIDKIIE